MLATLDAPLPYAARLVQRDVAAARRRLAQAEVLLLEAQRARQRAVCHEHRLAEEVVTARRALACAERAAAKHAVPLTLHEGTERG